MSWRDVVLMLAQRLPRWPHIRPTLLQCFVFKAVMFCARQMQDITVSTCWISAGPTSKMVVCLQHWTSIARTLGFARQVSVWERVMSGDTWKLVDNIGFCLTLSGFILSMPGYIKQHLWLKNVFFKYDISVAKFLFIESLPAIRQ